MMWWDGSGWSAGDWALMMLMMGLFLLLIVGTVVWAVAALRRGGVFAAPGVKQVESSRAERMLDERFARGDLTEDEYLEQRSLLHRD